MDELGRIGIVDQFHRYGHAFAQADRRPGHGAVVSHGADGMVLGNIYQYRANSQCQIGRSGRRGVRMLCVRAPCRKAGCTHSEPRSESRGVLIQFAVPRVYCAPARPFWSVLFSLLASHLHFLSNKGVANMNWDQLQSDWTHMRGPLRHRWGRLTEDDLDVIAGHRDVFIGRVQERYSIGRAEAQARIEEWLRTLQEEKVLTGRA